MEYRSFVLYFIILETVLNSLYKRIFVIMTTVVSVVNVLFFFL